MKLTDRFPIMDIEHGCILSVNGDVTAVYQLELPEIFTLSGADYEHLHQAWLKSIRSLPPHFVLHKQDWFTGQKVPDLPATGMLEQGSSAHFKGRPYLGHHAYLMLTQKAGSKTSSSLHSGLLSGSLVPAGCLDPSRLENFEKSCAQFKSILEDSKMISMQRLGRDQLASSAGRQGLIERYLYLSDQQDAPPIIKDITLDKSLRIGHQECQLYTLAGTQELPHFCGPRIRYERFSTDKTDFPVGFAAPLGLLLSCPHIYNQYIFTGDAPALLRKLEKKRLRLQSLSAFSRENAVTEDAVNSFLNEAIADQQLPVKAHFNIQVWSEEAATLKANANLIASALSRMEATAKLESVGAAQIWWAGIPGNAGDFPMNECFDTFAAQASCFLSSEGNYKSGSAHSGIRFCERLFNRPVYTDLFDAPRKKGLTTNMGTLVCGSSGGGKSMTVNHILRSLHAQGAHCVTVDIGGSYKGLCELLGGYYFSYTEQEPISFNPFYLPAGQALDTEKKESLKSLLIALWKQEGEHLLRSEYVGLSDALQGYYQWSSECGQFTCFNTFFEYMEQVFSGRLDAQKVKEKDFDLANFLYVMRPYYRGGEFDFLLNARDNLDLLQQPFIVIELDNIKDHPILFPVVTLIIMEMFISKMRKLGKTRKVLTIDEAWKAIARSGMAEFLKYAFKTIRKFNGIPIVVTQELDDLISSPIIKEAIINNADIKILMDMKKYLHKFDRLQDVLGLSEKGKNILLSVNKDKREIFIDLGGQEMKVYRNELCPEEYYAFTTEGKERVKVAAYAQRHGSIQDGIRALIQDLKTNRQ